MLESPSKLPNGQKSLHRIGGGKNTPSCFCLGLQTKHKHILVASGKVTFLSATEKQVSLPQQLDKQTAPGETINNSPEAESRMYLQMIHGDESLVVGNMQLPAYL